MTFGQHNIISTSALSFIFYDMDTVHLLTRHHRRVPPKGYIQPLAGSSWIAFLLVVWSTLAVMHMRNHYFSGKQDMTDVLPLFYMFHYEVNSSLLNILKKWAYGNACAAFFS